MENSTNVAQSDIRRFYVVVFDGISSTVTLLEEERRHCGDYMDESNRNCLCQFHEIPWKSDHGCTARIYFDNAGDNVTLALYSVTLTSQKPC